MTRMSVTCAHIARPSRECRLFYGTIMTSNHYKSNDNVDDPFFGLSALSTLARCKSRDPCEEEIAIVAFYKACFNSSALSMRQSTQTLSSEDYEHLIGTVYT